VTFKQIDALANGAREIVKRPYRVVGLLQGGRQRQRIRLQQSEQRFGHIAPRFKRLEGGLQIGGEGRAGRTGRKDALDQSGANRLAVRSRQDRRRGRAGNRILQAGGIEPARAASDRDLIEGAALHGAAQLFALKEVPLIPGLGLQLGGEGPVVLGLGHFAGGKAGEQRGDDGQHHGGDAEDLAPARGWHVSLERFRNLGFHGRRGVGRTR
jgi:hypothetical protein